ncbi:MAG: peptidoglycan-N-acetylglucosamine deacetylase [Cryptosporangiaceae bacterium]|nr:peptidoglycan-N-acetylglucosamine deacetylase [Cryptosporangiaceae bacterium]
MTPSLISRIAETAPLLTTLAPLRRRYAPALAGYGDPGHIALTFDDGPDPASTPQFLDALSTLDVRATFFLLGSMLAKAPWLGRELTGAGHELAVHGWDHRSVALRGELSTYRGLARTRDLIGEVTGTVPVWYRPPYGVLTRAASTAARRAGLTPILWTAWGRDWEASARPESVRRRVRATLTGGGTILLHDSDCTSAPRSWVATLRALPGIVADCRDLGATVGPLAEHSALAHPEALAGTRPLAGPPA